MIQLRIKNSSLFEEINIYLKLVSDYLISHQLADPVTTI